MEHRERKRCEKPKLPRTATKISAKEMESEMEILGVEIDNKDDVRLRSDL